MLLCTVCDSLSFVSVGMIGISPSAQLQKGFPRVAAATLAFPTSLPPTQIKIKEPPGLSTVRRLRGLLLPVDTPGVEPGSASANSHQTASRSETRWFRLTPSS